MTAVADAGEEVGEAGVGLDGDQGADPVPVQGEAQVEEGRATGQALFAAGGVSGRQSALRIGPQLDQIGFDAEPPRLAVVQRRRATRCGQ